MNRMTKFLWASAGAAALVAGVAVTADAAGAPIPPNTVHGCVVGPARTLEHVFTSNTKGTTCSSGFQVVMAQPQGVTVTPPSSATATTSVSDRDDSGNHGNWATDAFTRTVTVNRKNAADVSNCGGGAVVCYFYTASLADNGSFVTDSGANSPNAGTPVSGTVQGTFTGGSAIQFYAGSANAAFDGTPNSALVPATVSGDSPGTTAWVEQFFGSGTIFSTPQLLNWSWTYNAPNTCEQWVDAFNNGDGGQPADGDIAGINNCA